MKHRCNPILGLSDIQAKIAPGDRITAQGTPLISNGKLVRLEPMAQRVRPKPLGLWWGFGNSWLDWVSRNVPELIEEYNALYRLLLDDRRILTLGSHDDLLAFSNDFGVTMPGEPATDLDFVDWPRVAQRWEGVELFPFSRDDLYDKGASSMNPKLGWAYPWDVPSGCLWDFDVIRGVEILYEQRGS
jgi:hypothetical protein